VNTYDPLEYKLVVDGKEYTVEGISGDIYSAPFTRKWWKLNDFGNYELTCKDGLMLQVTPKDPEEFYNKYLKDLPDIEESPFDWKKRGV
jgi:hypothetical protein